MVENKIKKLCQLISESHKTLIFTGAGISTESGIPDFRSPGGYWTENKPILFEKFINLESARRKAWHMKFEIDKMMVGAKPNQGHKAITALIKKNLVHKVITQNIDGLHQLSGIPPELVIELHGNGTYAACLECEAKYELGPIKTAFLEKQILPICNYCSGIVKTATISFGQPMPKISLVKAQIASTDCDLLIAIGSSLVVFPAANLVPLAKLHAAKVVIINREETKLDELAELVINAEIGETLSEVVKELL